MEKKKPEQYGQLHDPKLPIIHGQTVGNRVEQRICPSPIEQTKVE